MKIVRFTHTHTAAGIGSIAPSAEVLNPTSFRNCFNFNVTHLIRIWEQESRVGFCGVLTQRGIEQVILPAS